MDKNMEPLICEISSGNLETKFGRFRIYYFSDGRDDAVALVKGEDIYGEEDVLCRIHSQCFFAEAFYSAECDCSEQLEFALEAIQAQGGILIYLFQNGRGYGLAPLISTQDFKEQGMDQQQAYEHRGFYGIERSFDIAAKILLYFNINSIRLITKNKAKFEGIRKYGITVNDAGLNSSVVIFDKKTKNQVCYQQMEIMKITKKTIVVISDLNVDEILYLRDDDGKFCGFREGIKETTGGCAFNAASIFKKENLDPIILGSVGDDANGKLVLKDLEKHDLKAFLYKSCKPTGKSQILYRNDRREIFSDSENANEYDSKIAAMMGAMRLNGDNIIYVTTHMLMRGTRENVMAISDSLYQSKAKIVIDIVPHNIYKSTTWDYLCEVFRQPVFMLICELKTMISFHPGLSDTIGEEEEVEDQVFEEVLGNVCSSKMDMEYLVLRYGYQNIGKQRVYKKHGAKFKLCFDERTGFKKIEPQKRIGYGEVLTAILLEKYHYGGNNDN